MPSLFRSISQRFRRSAKRRPNGQPGTSGYQMGFEAPEMDPKKQCQCKVMLLDGSDLNIVVPKNALGQEVYDQVFYTLDLEERDYFGLLFMDHYHVQHWLDPLKKLSKQVPIGPPYTFRFSVKFYTCEPSNLREELTRYQFFLQLKQDIQTGKLECPKEMAIELAALALQSELGDYNPAEHTPALISEFRFHPEQNEEMEIAILEQFVICRGQSPATAELNYLNKAKWLELYGVDMHIVEGKDGNTYRLGLTPVGCLVFDGNQKIGLFSWEKIQKLDFKNRKLTLVVEEDADSASGQVQLHTFVFNLASHKACKHLWKCAIEHHTFFRLKFHHAKNRKTSQLFRLGSTFKYRGRTEYENMHKDVGRLSRRQSSTFERRPSQRYGPRQTLINRRIQLRNEIKQQVAASIGLTVPNATAGSEVPEPYVEKRKAEECLGASTLATNSPKLAPVAQSNPITCPVKPSATVLPTSPLLNGKVGTPTLPVKDILPPERVMAAEARLESLIYNAHDLNSRSSNIPPPVVKKLNSSPQAGHRLMNGTKLPNTGNDILLNGHAEQKPDIGINVQLNAKNVPGTNGYPLPSPGHVTKIAISTNGSQSQMMSRNMPTVSSASRIPKYTLNNNNNNNNNTPSGCTPPISPLSPSTLSATSDSCQLAAGGSSGQIGTNEKQMNSPSSSGTSVSSSNEAGAKPMLATLEASSASVNQDSKVTKLLDIPCAKECLTSMQTNPESSTDLSDSFPTKTTTPAVNSVSVKGVSATASTSKVSAIPVPSAAKEKDIGTKEEKLTMESKSSKDAEKLSRSRLPVRSTTSLTSQESTKKITLDEKLSQSKIPKMASGNRPHQYFGPLHHGDRSIPGATTYIPIVKTGIPTSQSRIITDL